MVSSFIQQENMEALVQLKLSNQMLMLLLTSQVHHHHWMIRIFEDHIKFQNTNPGSLLNLLLQTISYITLFQLHFGYFIVTFSVLALI